MNEWGWYPPGSGYPPPAEKFPQKNYQKPHSLDAAYQRKAIDDGWDFDEKSLFPENVEYYKDKHK